MTDERTFPAMRKIARSEIGQIRINQERTYIFIRASGTATLRISHFNIHFDIPEFYRCHIRAGIPPNN
eukprot:scaffold1054_cov124-Cylindrotheca_fusiformis.AAC.8